ncbi:hypothetical protein Syun_007982 [Stephania yunnanensis]|uniref:Uncharacterized protein n=1 Tax=Stephania yunnanensis TaxID=152371 RepID=A0AAP0KZQ9_9MAGN
MAEKKSCKALIIGRASTKATSKPPELSYFIAINFNRGDKNSSARGEAAKVRIRIPKLLAKVIKRSDRNESERNRKDAKKKLFIKKIASLFGKGEKVVKDKGNGDGLDEEGSVEDQSSDSKVEKFYESASDESKLFVSTTASSINSDESEEEGKENHQVSHHALSLTSKSALKNKSTSASIPTTTSRNGGNCSGRVGEMKRASSFPGGVFKSLMKQKAMRKQCSSGIARNGHEEVKKDDERAERFELCKKQILKGGKCRPLTLTWSPSIRGNASTADLSNKVFYSD